MNKTVARKWIQALRSGKYEQARAELRNGLSREFCCLGVLCDISRKGGRGVWRKGGIFLIEGERNGGFLPLSVREWAGVSSRQQSTLSVANDNGKSFSEIASMIAREAGL